MGRSNLSSKLAYEFHIILFILKVFGLEKAFLFILHLPGVFLAGANRPAFDAMGKCRTVISGKQIVSEHPAPRFIDEIMVRRCYNPDERFKIKSDDVIVDIGANIGVFTIFAAMQAPTGLIVSVEPEKTNFKYLEDNIRANNLSNVLTVNAAVSNQAGEVQLFLSKKSGSNTIIPHQVNPRVATPCKAITMNDLFQSFRLNHMDFLKIDIEGAEFEIFEECGWLSRVNAIAMEVHPNIGNCEEIISKLTCANFNVKKAQSYDADTFYLFAYHK